MKLECPRCNMCGSEDFRVLLHDVPDLLLAQPGEWSICECVSCGLAQLRPRPGRDSIHAFYPPAYELSIGSRDTAPGSGTRRAIGEIAEAPARLRYGPQRCRAPADDRHRELLEIGCAAGVNLARYAQVGWNVSAVEPSAELAAAAAERAGVSPERITVASAEEARFSDDSFDLIVMYHVIEHLHDPLAVLCSARRWLRDEGMLEIGCPNFGSLQRRIYGRYWMGLDPPRHLYHFTPATLTAMLERAGFTVTSVVPEQEHVSTALSVGAALDGLFGRRRPMGSGRSARVLFAAIAPFAALSRAFGARPCMLVTAEPA